MGPKRGFPSEDRTSRRCFGLFDLLRVHSQKLTMSVGSSLSSLVGGGGSASKNFSRASRRPPRKLEVLGFV
jgi:hypothetical protein